MSAVDTGGPAFPVDADWYVTESGVPDWYCGMTMRDYFAAKAMAAMIGTAASPCLGGLENTESITARYAYKMADAMLAEAMEARAAVAELIEAAREAWPYIECDPIAEERGVAERFRAALACVGGAKS